MLAIFCGSLSDCARKGAIVHQSIWPFTGRIYHTQDHPFLGSQIELYFMNPRKPIESDTWFFAALCSPDGFEQKKQDVISLVFAVDVSIHHRDSYQHRSGFLRSFGGV